jgi:hypothetical protein
LLVTASLLLTQEARHQRRRAKQRGQMMAYQSSQPAIHLRACLFYAKQGQSTQQTETIKQTSTLIKQKS